MVLGFGFHVKGWRDVACHSGSQTRHGWLRFGGQVQGDPRRQLPRSVERFMTASRRSVSPYAPRQLLERATTLFHVKVVAPTLHFFLKRFETDVNRAPFVFNHTLFLLHRKKYDEYSNSCGIYFRLYTFQRELPLLHERGFTKKIFTPS